jgi:HK97 family phage major capsid protein
MSGGQPDRLLGERVYFDPNVASMASDAKIMFYGDWSAYFIRDVKTFRSAAINCLHQAVT